MGTRRVPLQVPAQAAVLYWTGGGTQRYVIFLSTPRRLGGNQQLRLRETLSLQQRQCRTYSSSVDKGKNMCQILIWKKSDQWYNINCLAPTFKSAHSSIMVSEAFIGDKIQAPLGLNATKKTNYSRIHRNYIRWLFGTIFG